MGSSLQQPRIYQILIRAKFPLKQVISRPLNDLEVLYCSFGKMKYLLTKTTEQRTRPGGINLG